MTIQHTFQKLRTTTVKHVDYRALPKTLPTDCDSKVLSHLQKKCEAKTSEPMRCCQIKTAKKYYTESIHAKTKLLHFPVHTFGWNWL
jgi:hypothetical protein